ncbi:MAG: ATP-binding protein [bacterium]
MIKLQSVDSSQFLGKPFSKGKHTIGRSHANDFEISATSISRRHAMLDIRDNNQIYLTDLNSRNGTKVNGDLISGTVQLAIGDEVTFGDVMFEVVTADTGGPTRDTLDKFDTGETEESSIVLPFDEARRQLPGIFNNPRTSQALCEIGRVVVDSDNLDTVLMKSLKLLHRAVASERVVVLSANPDQTVSVAAGYPAKSMETGKFSVSTTIVNEVLSKQVAIVVVDTQCDSRFTNKSPSVEVGLRSIMAVPLIEQNAVTGILYADSTLDGIKFTEDHLRAFAAFGDILAAKLENCRLIREKCEQAVLEAKLHASQHKQEELAEANRMLHETQAQLLQSEKMAALGRLVAGIAHEINTPLAAANSMHSTLMTAVNRLKHTKATDSGGGNDLSVEKMLKLIADADRVICTANERITTIVKRLRTFARLDEAELKEVDIHEGLDDTLGLARSQLGDHISVTTDYGQIPPLVCYPGMLNQVFLNLLINAAQAIEGKGAIKIRTFAVDDLICIQFEDTGCGIPADQLRRIFEPGFTTKGSGVGTGLGLSICYQIIQQHKGEIRVSSELDRGTTMTIDLPCNPPRRDDKKK